MENVSAIHKVKAGIIEMDGEAGAKEDLCGRDNVVKVLLKEVDTVVMDLGKCRDVTARKDMANLAVRTGEE